MAILLTAILTFTIALFYFRYRLKFNISELCLTCIFVLGHAFYLESSYYLRFYIFLNLSVLLSFICLWEAHLTFQEKKLAKYIWAVLGCIFALLPTLDQWQKTHIPIIALTVAMFYISRGGVVLNFIKRQQKIIVFSILMSVLLAPYFTLIMDQILIRVGMKIGSRSYMGYHHYYWDNVWGLLKFVTSLNILIWIFIKDFKLKRDYKLGELLFYSGIISGLVIGLYVPHNHIFFTRFFLLSTFMATLGGGTVLWNYNSKLALKYSIIFLLCNFLISIVTYQYERPKVSTVSEWLDQNYQGLNQILLADFDYVWNTKKKYPNTLFYSNSSSQNNVGEIVSSIEKMTGDTVFYFYYNHYDFRERLHRFIFSNERTPANTISRFLIKNDKGIRIFNLRGTGLIKYQKSELILLLKNFRPDNGIERINIIRQTKNFFHSLRGLN